MAVGWFGAGAAEPETRTVLAPKPTQQPPAHGTLKVIAFGLENCDSRLTKFCEAKGGGHECEVPKHVLLAALARMGEPRVNLLLDTRCFPDDAESTGRRCRHPGTNPTNISGIANHKNFRKFLKRTAEAQMAKSTQTAESCGTCGGGLCGSCFL